MNRMIFATLALLLFFSYGCSNSPNLLGPSEFEAVEMTPVTIEVNFAQRIAADQGTSAAKSAATESIDRATVYVYDTPWTTNGTPIVTRDLTISNKNVASGNIDVPIAAGDSSRVVDIHIVFYGEDDPQNPIVRYYGESTYELIIHETNTVSITAVYMGVDTQLHDGSHLVDYLDLFVFETINLAWNDVTNGLSALMTKYGWTYTLEESFNNINFPSPNTIYTGINKTFSIVNGYLVDGDYYFRTCVNTYYGDGPWYSTGIATASVAPVKSTIKFKIVLPGDEPF